MKPSIPNKHVPETRTRRNRHFYQHPWRRWIEVLAIIAPILVLIALIIPAVLDARIAARKTTSKNKLRMFGIGFHNRYDIYKAFPPGALMGEDENALHGWCTLIMPFIGGGLNHPIYRVNSERPWDDAENEYHFRMSPWLWKMPGVSEICTVNGYGVTHYVGNPNLLHRGSHVKLKEMTSGTSNTWMVGESAGNYQPWGYPFNWRPLGTQLNNGAAGYGRPSGDGVHLMMADGSVRFLGNDVDPEYLKTLASAPPVAAPEATSVPERRFNFGPEWDADDLELDGGPVRVRYDGSGVPHTLSVVVTYATRNARTLGVEDLKRVARNYPELRDVSWPAIDDEAAAVLSELKDLEVFYAKSITLTQPGLHSFRELPKLKLVVAEEISRKALNDLTRALPDTEVRATKVNDRVFSLPFRETPVPTLDEW
jgi:hypothetical protein